LHWLKDVVEPLSLLPILNDATVSHLWKSSDKCSIMGKLERAVKIPPKAMEGEERVKFWVG
jgi:hypothetical protein